MIVNIEKVRGIITLYRQNDFHIKKVKPQFSDLAVLNITLYIVLGTRVELTHTPLHRLKLLFM